jgi:hypothetical protein
MPLFEKIQCVVAALPAFVSKLWLPMVRGKQTQDFR